MRQRTVSVIMSVFNGARYLAAAIDSVAGQALRVDEIIVVDDGSTDGSAEIARRHPFGVIYVHQRNAGLAAARNHGLSIARGALIGFLDADDLWTAGRIERQMEALAGDREAVIVFGHVEQFVSEDLSEQERGRLRFLPGPQPGYLAGAMLARRQVFDRVGWFETELRTGEFISWHLRCREHGIAEIMLPDLVLRRRLHRHNHGITQRDSRVDYTRILRAHLKRRREAAP